MNILYRIVYPKEVTMTRITSGSLVLVLSLTVAFPLGAQRVGRDPLAARAERTHVDAVPMVVGGTLGSFAGLWAGLYLAANYGGEGGLLLVPSLVGASALGTAIGIDLGSGGSVSFSDALGAALMGTLAGMGTAYLVGSADGAGWGGVVMGYSIGQGTLAGVMTALAGNPRGADGR
jgi:hypothetical protein